MKMIKNIFVWTAIVLFVTIILAACISAYYMEVENQKLCQHLGYNFAEVSYSNEHQRILIRCTKIIKVPLDELAEP